MWWIAAIFIALFGAIAVEKGVKEFQIGECRTVAIQKGVSPSDISKICK